MRRHPFDPWSFVAGALFLAIALAFLPGHRSVADVSPAWFWTLPLLGLGLLVVLTGIRRAVVRSDGPHGGVTSSERSPSRRRTG